VNKREVFSQIKFGKRGQDGAEDQKSKKGDQGHGEKFVGKKITQSLLALKISEDPVEEDKQGSPDQKAEGSENQPPKPPPCSPPVFKGENAGHKKD